jgi:hypothetical protein
MIVMVVMNEIIHYQLSIINYPASSIAREAPFLKKYMKKINFHNYCVNNVIIFTKFVQIV